MSPAAAGALGFVAGFASAVGLYLAAGVYVRRTCQKDTR
jgi:hypothetical protein